MSGAAGSSQWMYASGFELEQSLKFNDDDSQHLQRIFTSGNRQAMSLSFWFKRGTLGTTQLIFCATIASGGSNNDNNFFAIRFESNDKIAVVGYDTAWLTTNRVFSDTSAWYHCLLEVNSTSGSSYNRVKMAINGTYLPAGEISTSYPSENHNHSFNVDGNFCNISSRTGWLGDGYFDGYLAEMHYIDGSTGYDQTHFGETGDYGEWKPIEVDAITDYGTNGFYLPFKNGTASGFSCTTYTGDGNDSSNGRYIGGVGFEYDLLWIKDRNASRRHFLTSSNIGYNKNLQPDSTAAQESATDRIEGQEDDGFKVGHRSEVNHDGNKFVAWAWDMSESGETINDASATGIGSVDCSYNASPTYGQSSVTYTSTSGAACTVAHGLNSAPEMIIYKVRDATRNWSVYHKDTNEGTNDEQYVLRLNTDAAKADSGDFDDTAPTSTVFSDYLTAGASETHAFCFHSVTGYSKVGSYSGTGSSNAITTGFAPIFVLIKKTNTSENWYLYDNVRTGNTMTVPLTTNNDSAEGGNDTLKVTFQSDGFTLVGANNGINVNGGFYIYYAVSGGPDPAYYKDQSGKGNDFYSGHLTASDIVLDTPSNNFSNLNPQTRPAFGDGESRGLATLSSGNLRFDTVASQSTYLAAATSFDLGRSGKWYAEFYCDTHDGSGSLALGITFDFQVNWYYAHQPGEKSNTWGYNSAGSVTNNNSAVSGTYASYSKDDIVQLAVDLDNGKFYVGKNNSWQEQNPANGNGIDISAYAKEFCLITCGATNSNQKAGTWNFGQDSSFGGRRAPESNGDYDFFYAPPSGYKALCQKDLPAVIKPQENFSTTLYTGTGSSNAISVGFQPDLVILKMRTQTYNHNVFDSLRGGGGKYLYTDTNEAQNTIAERLKTFDSNGFTVGTQDAVNQNTHTFASWNWKANGGAASVGSNTNGSINTTDTSVNTAAGFSISTYTGTGSSATIGHGLSKAPEMIWVKKINAAGDWMLFFNTPANDNLNNTSDATDYYRLNGNQVATDSNNAWDDTVPTTTVWSAGSDGAINGDGNTYVAYCWHSVDGYSKIGAYRGTGNAAGAPFIHTGFRPSWVVVKQSSNAGDWYVYDIGRDGYNSDNDSFRYNSNGVENTDDNINILSNGFRLLNTNSEHNASGQLFVFMAFAEVPLKYANAR